MDGRFPNWYWKIIQVIGDYGKNMKQIIMVWGSHISGNLHIIRTWV